MANDVKGIAKNQEGSVLELNKRSEASLNQLPNLTRGLNSDRANEVRTKFSELRGDIQSSKNELRSLNSSDAVKTDLRSRRTELKTNIRESKDEIRELREEVRGERKRQRSGEGGGEISIQPVGDPIIGKDPGVSPPPISSEVGLSEQAPPQSLLVEEEKPISTLPTSEPPLIVDEPQVNQPESSQPIVAPVIADTPRAENPAEGGVPATLDALQKEFEGTQSQAQSARDGLTNTNKQLSGVQNRRTSLKQLGQVLDRQVELGKRLELELRRQEETGLKSDKVDELASKIEELETQRSKLTGKLNGRTSDDRVTKELLLDRSVLQSFVADRTQLKTTADKQQQELTRREGSLQGQLTSLRSTLNGATEALKRYEQVVQSLPQQGVGAIDSSVASEIASRGTTLPSPKLEAEDSAKVTIA
jgi:uncharacterized protein YhaN